jgi:hypothetical protein
LGFCIFYRCEFPGESGKKPSGRIPEGPNADEPFATVSLPNGGKWLILIRLFSLGLALRERPGITI